VQTSNRLDSSCAALSRWIDSSSSLAFRVFGGPVPETRDELATAEEGVALASGRLKERSPIVSGRLKERSPFIAGGSLECRASLYLTLLSIQIDATGGKTYSDTLFAGEREWTTNHETHTSVTRSSEYSFNPKEQFDLVQLLCREICAPIFEMERGSRGSTRKISENFALKEKLRFNVLQFILGLDERWSYELTVSLCMRLLAVMEKADPLSGSRSQNGFNFGPINLLGRIKSSLLTPSSVNVLAAAFPPHVIGRDCTIVYALSEHGSAATTLIHLAEQFSHRACMCVLEDIQGHVFGGFLDTPLHHKPREYFGSGASFVFKVLPSTKIYPWTKR
jgi:hypothetical protein